MRRSHFDIWSQGSGGLVDRSSACGATTTPDISVISQNCWIVLHQSGSNQHITQFWDMNKIPSSHSVLPPCSSQTDWTTSMTSTNDMQIITSRGYLQFWSEAVDLSRQQDRKMSFHLDADSWYDQCPARWVTAAGRGPTAAFLHKTSWSNMIRWAGELESFRRRCYRSNSSKCLLQNCGGPMFPSTALVTTTTPKQLTVFFIETTIENMVSV